MKAQREILNDCGEVLQDREIDLEVFQNVRNKTQIVLSFETGAGVEMITMNRNLLLPAIAGN